MQEQYEEPQTYVEQITIPQLNTQTFNGYKTHQRTANSLPSQGFVTRYDPEDKYITIGCYNGQKLLYSFDENKIISQVKQDQGNPVTCMRWRPTTHSQTKVIAIGSANGKFQYYHVPSMKVIFEITEQDNSILCCDFSKTGSHFSTAGKDCKIRVYDEQTKSISTTLGNAEWNYPGHSNRIFSVKFIDQSTMVSGGWDSVIHFWDLRQAKSTNSFYGPHIAGDSIDIKDYKLLTGCYASKAQLQLWDIRNLQKIEEISWPCSPEEVAYIYTAGFNHFGSESIIAGACGVNQVRVFTGSNKHSTSVRLHGLQGGCYSVDSSYKHNQISLVTSKKAFYIYTVSRQ